MSDDVIILSSRVLLMYIILCLRPALEMRISETESNGILRNAHKKKADPIAAVLILGLPSIIK